MSVLNTVSGAIPIAFVFGFLIGFILNNPTMKDIKEPAKKGVRAGLVAVAITEAAILSAVFIEWITGIG